MIDLWYNVIYLVQINRVGTDALNSECKADKKYSADIETEMYSYIVQENHVRSLLWFL